MAGSVDSGGNYELGVVELREFDVGAFFEALDRQRVERHLSWRQVADEMWQLSSVLNQRRQSHPISPSTITGMEKRGDTSCQHALFFLRWLDRTPESFLSGSVAEAVGTILPEAGPDRRLRWNLAATYLALDERRRQRHLTWPQAARQLRCSASQLTGIRTAKYAIAMTLAMRIVQWVQRPAADFVYPAEW
jgi:hypothetical protein